MQRDRSQCALQQKLSSLWRRANEMLRWSGKAVGYRHGCKGAGMPKHEGNEGVSGRKRTGH